jgi:hypothetical protein
MREIPQQEWHALEIGEAIEALGTDAGNGLTTDEAQERA